MEDITLQKKQPIPTALSPIWAKFYIIAFYLHLFVRALQSLVCETEKIWLILTL